LCGGEDVFGVELGDFGGGGVWLEDVFAHEAAAVVVGPDGLLEVRVEVRGVGFGFEAVEADELEQEFL